VGTLVSGSVTVSSDRPLAGVILFGGSIGVAGVGSGAVLSGSFSAPMETNLSQGIDTGIALQSQEEGKDVTLDLQMVDADGKVLASARLDGANAIKSNGHMARFLREFSWSPAVDVSNFAGVLRITPSGKVSATVLQVRANQLATLPVVSP
jgi:hypothetical protein